MDLVVSKRVIRDVVIFCCTDNDCENGSAATHRRIKLDRTREADA